jgi:hypothetical protein
VSTSVTTAATPASTASTPTAEAAHAEAPYSYCLKTDGVPYDSNPEMYISVGKKVLKSLQGGTDFYTAVNELEKEGAPPNVAAAIAACASKVNCPDLLHCGP